MATEVDRLIVTLEAKLGTYEANMRRGQQITNQRLDQMERRFSTFAKNANVSIGSVGAIAGTLGAYLSGRELVGYANAWTRVTRSISGGEQVFGVRLQSAEKLNELASDARVDLEAYSKLYIRTAGAIRDYGFEAGTAEKVTSTLAKALKLGGATASEQTSVLLQFSQALNKGKLDGDEFRTVMENASVVQELLADRLKVSKGEVIKLAAEGKLKINDLVRAMTEGADKVDRIFRKLPQTVDEGWQVLNNAVTQYVGHLDSAYGLSSSFSGLMGVLARNIETVGDAALVLSTGLTAAFAPRITASIVGMAAAAGALLSPLALILGAIAASGAALALFSDDIKLTEDGTVTLNDVFKDLIESLGKTDKSLKKLDPGKDIVAGLAKEAKFAKEEFEKLAKAIDAGAQKFDEFAQESAYYTGGLVNGRPPDPNGGGSGNGLGLIDRLAAQNGRLGQLGTGLGSYLRGEVPEGKTAAPGGGEDDRKFETSLARIKKRTEALLAEAQAYGQSEAAKTRAVTLEQLLSDAQRAGLELTPERLKAINDAVDAYSKISAKVAFLNKLQSAKEGEQAIKDELRLIGLTGTELERARIEQELYNEAKRQGVELTPQLDAEVKRIARTTAELKQQKDVLLEIGDISKDALKGFIGDLQQGKSAAEALASVLNKIADKLLDFGVNSLVDGLLGALKNGGGGGGVGLGGLLGFSQGGIVRGPGSGTSDSVPAALSNGEFVVNERATSRNRKLLEAINSGAMARFADGGMVGAAPIPVPVLPAAPAPASARPAPTQINMPVNFNVQNGTPEGVEKLKREIVPMIRQVAQGELAQQIDRHPVFAPLRRR